METVKYVFAILITVPIAVLGFFLISQFVNENLTGKKKADKKEEKKKRKAAQGFTIKMPDEYYDDIVVDTDEDTDEDE